MRGGTEDLARDCLKSKLLVGVCLKDVRKLAQAVVRECSNILTRRLARLNGIYGPPWDQGIVSASHVAIWGTNGVLVLVY